MAHEQRLGTPKAQGLQVANQIEQLRLDIIITTITTSSPTLPGASRDLALVKIANKLNEVVTAVNDLVTSDSEPK